MFRNKSVNVHKFAMIPRADIPRSKFHIEKAHKTTFDAGYLIPIYVDEVLPGDTISLDMTGFGRLATPIFPLMDNLHVDSQWFFVPNRLVWSNWVRFMGEQDNPDDSTDFTVPQIVSKSGGYDTNSLYDYLGLPTAGQIAAGKTFSHSALWLRAYNLVFNTWYRDENLQDALPVNKDSNGPDLYTQYNLVRRGKRHDYFTSCLPWTQKGDPVTLPIGGQAPVLTSGTDTVTGVRPKAIFRHATDGALTGNFQAYFATTGSLMDGGAAGGAEQSAKTVYPSNLYADLSQATAATINSIRTAFQIQRLLERDARGGTRYTELLRSHFGVVPEDMRLQRPEYLHGSSSPVQVSPVTQNQSTDTGTTPLGTLAGTGTLVHKSGFTYSAREHGMILGLVSIRADLSYQQGLRKMWSRKTKYDFYWPVFAALGEQAVLNKEIYCTGDVTDDDVFGYQERWAELRYNPSQISGRFKSTSQAPLDAWHLAQKFANLPTLNATFIQDTPPVERVVAVGAQALGSQFLWDSFFSVNVTRALPAYGVPGLVDHF